MLNNNEYTQPSYITDAVNEHLKRVSSNFTPLQIPMLKELVLGNINYPDYPKDFDRELLVRYQTHSELLAKLNELNKPSIGHLVQVLCQNKKVYEQALITSINSNEVTICVNGGGFIHSERLMNYGLSMTICGGYSIRVPLTALVSNDQYSKTFTFSGTGRVEAYCGISIERFIKRWIIDDRNGILTFY